MRNSHHLSQSSPWTVLGIESSCDDSSVSIIDQNFSEIATLTQAHLESLQPYQGIMPEVASREHCRYMPLLIEELLKNNAMKNVRGIGVTAGPGLAGSLLVGHAVARTLHLLLNVPLIPIHHLEGHLCAIFLSDPSPIQFPAIGFIVSGGHTQLILMEKPFSYQIIGQTRDDAAGEAFDKIAKSLGMPYPGGPVLAAHAQQSQLCETFSIPMSDSNCLDFSFSGLKTQATRSPLKETLPLNDYCAMVEETITEALIIKCQKALKKIKGVKTLILSGGVACNQRLRKKIHTLCAQQQCQLRIPLPRYCTDNGAMIAAAAHYHLLNDGPALSRKMGTYPQWSLESEPNFN